jgi:hypothetical protein
MDWLFRTEIIMGLDFETTFIGPVALRIWKTKRVARKLMIELESGG